MLLAILALTLAPTHPAPAIAPHPCGDELGAFDWFAGPWFSALGRARAEQRMILVAFVADGYPWCDKLAQDTFANPDAAQAVEGLICIRVDLTPGSDGHPRDPRGNALTQRFPVQVFPSIFFVSAKGEPEDLFAGYIPPADFVREVARIRAGRDTRSDFAARIESDPKDIDLRLRFAAKLRDLGDFAGSDAQMATIHELDPDSTSLPMRNFLWEARLELAQSEFDDSKGLYDVSSLIEFLSEEKHDEVLFAGWSYLADLRAALNQEAESRRAYETAWSVVPGPQKIGYGVKLAQAWFGWRESLDAKEMAFALEVAEAAGAAAEAAQAPAPALAACLDAQACCQYMRGKRRDALATIDKAIALDPTQQAYELRRELFELRK